ncbi:hypothetical protein EYC80_005825 [Monilinia laxa]|uniref:Uncharacterized protein n=1 Tax=Monilinia laxa TaxID=61186 RepID=A0A5N6KF76_MONLA|nr:hypothetical protein EYC80_005825 [Monilinia laxa]
MISRAIFALSFLFAMATSTSIPICVKDSSVTTLFTIFSLSNYTSQFCAQTASTNFSSHVKSYNMGSNLTSIVLLDFIPATMGCPGNNSVSNCGNNNSTITGSGYMDTGCGTYAFELTNTKTNNASATDASSESGSGKASGVYCYVPWDRKKGLCFDMICHDTTTLLSFLYDTLGLVEICCCSFLVAGFMFLEGYVLLKAGSFGLYGYYMFANLCSLVLLCAFNLASIPESRERTTFPPPLFCLAFFAGICGLDSRLRWIPPPPLHARSKTRRVSIARAWSYSIHLIIATPRFIQSSSSSPTLNQIETSVTPPSFSPPNQSFPPPQAKMGWFDGASESGRSHSSRHHSSTHSHPGKKHHSTSRSTHHKNSSGLRGSVLGSTSPKSSHSHRERSRSRTRGSGSIFGSGDAKHNSSRGSFFGFNSRSTSHYKRSPRPNYLKSIYQKLRQLLRDLIYYMKRHPVKVFMLVIMPLITGGALAALLKKFGVRLPRGLEKLIGGGNGRGGGNETYEFERSSVRSSGGALEKLGMLAGGVEGVGGAMKLAKLFI